LEKTLPEAFPSAVVIIVLLPNLFYWNASRSNWLLFPSQPGPILRKHSESSSSDWKRTEVCKFPWEWRSPFSWAWWSGGQSAMSPLSKAITSLLPRDL
jgi:hypothetical protein